MENRSTYNDQLRNVLDQLAESVLHTTDTEISTEIRDGGSDPQELAEHTRAILRQAVTLFDAVNRRLWALGHAVDAKQWRPGESGYSNTCQSCGQVVSFSISTGEIKGNALTELC